MTGMIGCMPGLTLNPSFSRACLRNCAFSARRLRSSAPCRISSSAFKPAAQIIGGTAFENRYGRERWRSNSINSRRPAVKPPVPPPTDESHRGHAVPSHADRMRRRLYDRRMVGQAQVIIGAKVDDRPLRDADAAPLRAQQDALGLIQPRRPDLRELLLAERFDLVVR